MAEERVTEVRSDTRALLEQVAAALDLGAGRTQLRCEFRDGRLAWFEPSRVRVPASELEALSRKE